MLKLIEAFKMSKNNEKHISRFQNGHNIHPIIAFNNSVKVSLSESIVCPNCDNIIDFYVCNACSDCFQFCEEDYTDNVIKQMNKFEINCISKRIVDFYSATDGLLYKHNIDTFFCLTFYGYSKEDNELSHHPYDIYYYLTLVFINEQNRDEEYEKFKIFKEMCW